MLLQGAEELGSLGKSRIGLVRQSPAAKCRLLHMLPALAAALLWHAALCSVTSVVVHVLK